MSLISLFFRPVSPRHSSCKALLPALLVLAVGACGGSDGTGLPDDGSLRYRLADVDEKRLPTVLAINAGFDGVDTVRVTASSLTLRPDSTTAFETTLAHSGAGEPPWTEVVASNGTYAIASDTLTLCFDCQNPAGGGSSTFGVLVPFDSSGFILPLLFSTGARRAYRFVRR